MSTNKARWAQEGSYSLTAAIQCVGVLCWWHLLSQWNGMKCHTAGIHGIQSLSHFWAGLNVGACAQWLRTQGSNDWAATVEQCFVCDRTRELFWDMSLCTPLPHAAALGTPWVIRTCPQAAKGARANWWNLSGPFSDNRVVHLTKTFSLG